MNRWRRHIVATATLLVLALILSFVFANGGHVGPYRIPRLTHHDAPLPPNTKLPPTPRGATPCDQAPIGRQDHNAGQCLPVPNRNPVNPPALARPNKTSSLGAVNVAYSPAIKGCDRSNNDPLYGDARWRAVRASGVRFCYFKVSEATGFSDYTAKLQANQAYRAGIATGGYIFSHVCDNAYLEAALGVQMLVYSGLVPHRGANILPPVVDIEYPSSTPCNTVAWTNTLRAQVKYLLHGIDTDGYTGKWYWDPHLGCYRPAKMRRWVSGYGSLPVPCGFGGVDDWQYTDKGWDGSGQYIDMNSWIAGSKDFSNATNGAVTTASCCREGDRGQSVWLETHRLAIGGWLAHSGTFYSHHVALVVQAYQRQHHLSPSTGVTGPRTWNDIRVMAYRCRKYHKVDHR